MRLTIDEQERIVAVRGDKEHPLTRGYACIKGLQAAEAHHGPGRLLHPQMRMDDGSFVRIPLEQALDEIAGRLKHILDRDGPDALAAFRGTINVFSAVNGQMVADWLKSLGSDNFYTTMTIDQSAKWVTVQRLGFWAGGRQAMQDADVWLLAGNNPLVSLGSPCMAAHPLETLKAARARGMKLIVIDPRRSETARHADLFLQPVPGEDVAVAAGLLRLILSEGWQDEAFCARHVDGLAELRLSINGYTPDVVEQRAGISRDQLRLAARMFAHEGRRGIAHAGTGVTMGPHSNLADHLYDCLNVVCGRFLREGETIPNPGVMSPPWPSRAEVIPPGRQWEQGPRSRIGGYGMLFGEKMSGVLADEILAPGPGQIRSLFVVGGNPASAIPDQHKVVDALRSLELLVTIDPVMSTTARLSHYVLPPTVFYEHADLTPPLYESSIFSVPFSSYTPAVIPPPADAEVIDDWRVFWEVSRRMDRPLSFNGTTLDMGTAPTSDELHAILLRDARVPFERMRDHAGEVLDIGTVRVEPPGPESTGRFAVAPPDVVAELAQVLDKSPPPGFTHRLVSRRMRDVSNSMYHDFPAIRHRVPYNPAWMHPDDLAALGLADGDRIEIVSGHGRIPAIVEADADVRPGVVSMSHSWGGLPDDPEPYEQVGAYTGLLISTDQELEPINAMPRMSAVPVRIEQPTRS